MKRRLAVPWIDLERLAQVRLGLGGLRREPHVRLGRRDVEPGREARDRSTRSPPGRTSPANFCQFSSATSSSSSASIAIASFLRQLEHRRERGVGRRHVEQLAVEDHALLEQQVGLSRAIEVAECGELDIDQARRPRRDGRGSRAACEPPRTDSPADPAGRSARRSAMASSACASSGSCSRTARKEGKSAMVRCRHDGSGLTTPVQRQRESIRRVTATREIVRSAATSPRDTSRCIRRSREQSGPELARLPSAVPQDHHPRGARAGRDERLVSRGRGVPEARGPGVQGRSRRGRPDLGRAPDAVRGADRGHPDLLARVDLQRGPRGGVRPAQRSVRQG